MGSREQTTAPAPRTPRRSGDLEGREGNSGCYPARSAASCSRTCSGRHTHCSTGQRSCAPDLDLTDHLEPDLPAAAEPDHLELAPEEEGTDTEVEPKSEENDEPLVTEIVNKTATKPRPVVAEIKQMY